jgi:hypothetical protein
MREAQRLLAVAMLALAAYSVWWLGAPNPERVYVAEECLQSAAFSERERKVYASLAIRSLEELSASADLASGFVSRFFINIDNVILVLNDAGQVFLGLPPFRTGVSVRNSAAIRAKVWRGFIVSDVALALGITRCDAQHLVPDVGVATPEEARRMISEALKRLRAV